MRFLEHLRNTWRAWRLVYRLRPADIDTLSTLLVGGLIIADLLAHPDIAQSAALDLSHLSDLLKPPPEAGP